MVIPGICTFALGAAPQVYDERGNLIEVKKKSQNSIYVGLEGTVTRHNEEGLDSTKGEYSVGYTTLGGSVTAQYHFPEFFFDAGVGLMNLMNLTVNDVKISMANRSQLHLPVYTHIYYKFDPMFGLGTGFTHLTELSTYVDSQKVPDSSYHHLFLDLAAQVSPQISSKLVLTFTAVVGMNLIPGRQNVYSPADLLHVRFQFNLGLLYRIS